MSDRRQLRPIDPEADLRSCRNCRAVIDLSSGAPSIAESLASA